MIKLFFLFMKLFNYRNVKMMFVPLMGAFVQGVKKIYSQKESFFVILGGPVPGILLGIIGSIFAIHYEMEWLLELSGIFMILNMEYNTQNEQLIFKEYGRNIQRLVKEAIEIEDRDKRNAFENAIIALMGQLHPHLRNIDEFRFKLWHQLYILSDFKLDIDGPYPKPTREEVRLKTGDMPYPQQSIKHNSAVPSACN